MPERSKATWDNDIVTAFENLGGTASYNALYAEIERIRADLPPTWREVIRRRIQDLSSDSAGFKHGADIFFSVEGLGAGIWGLRSFLKNTPTANDLPLGNEEPSRLQTQVYRVLRDTVLARKIKLLHHNQCQICQKTVTIADGQTYSEAHHIRPLGAPHNGPDVPGNILVLCPNHHVLCDFGAIKLRLPDLHTANGHNLSSDYIGYHNTVIAGQAGT